MAPTAESAGEARAKLVGLVFGHMAAQVVATAVRLRLADRIGDGEMTAPELAAACEADPVSMQRLLRALAGLEVLREGGAGSFSLTGAGALLRTDRPDSVNAMVQMFTDPVMVQAWQQLDACVRTGETAFDEVFGTDFFAYLKGRPELSAQFNAAMSQGTRSTAAALPTGYDFAPFSTVVDIGGGDGTLLATILCRHQHLRGILYDTAEGVARAAQTLERSGVADRCEVRTGDFFASIPEGGDLYLLKSVVHDWDDQWAATILGLCRRVIPDHGRLLIVEPVLSDRVDGSTPALMYLSDLNMLVNVGGRERTRADFEDLCRRSGFRLVTVTALPPPVVFSAIEAMPA